jgi:hypothetical protein
MMALAGPVAGRALSGRTTHKRTSHRGVAEKGRSKNGCQEPLVATVPRLLLPARHHADALRFGDRSGSKRVVNEFGLVL